MLKKVDTIIFNKYNEKITIIIAILKKTSQYILTDADIPIVIAAKYTDSSKGDLTGFLNLTIDNAPTMPKDKAILPDITLVIVRLKQEAKLM